MSPHMPLPDESDLGSPHMPQEMRTTSEEEEAPDAPILYLKTSSSIVYPPPISTNNAVVMASDFDDSDEMFAAYPNVDDYLLVITGGGDFMSWGTWVITNRSGTAERYRTIRFFNVDDDYLHPWNRVGGNEALVDAIQFTGSSSYWMVCGLTQRASVGTNDVRGTAHHIVYSRFLVQGQLGNYGFQARGGDGCIVQQSLLINPDPGGGYVGISVDPITIPISGFKSLDNEVRNYVDGLLVGRNGDDPFMDVDVFSEGNDYYNTEDRFTGGGTTSPFENGIDIKGSSDAVQSVSRRDRIWNMRKTATAQGDAIEVHRQARNWLFDKTFVDNCQHVVFETPWDSPTSVETPRDIVITEGQFTNISAYYAQTGAGSMFRVANNLDVSDSWFADSDGILYVYSALRAGGPVFTGNTRIATEITVSGSLSSPYVENDNSIGDPLSERQVIQCQRWTGPTYRTGAKLGALDDTQEPVASFTRVLTIGTVACTDTSTAPGSSITARAWDFGDGVTSTSTNPSHTYPGNGIYTITLTVTAANGLTHKTQRNVWVTALPGPIMPRLRSIGAETTGTGAIVPALPTGITAGDILVLFVVSQGTQVTTLTSAEGFTEATCSPQDVGLASGSALTCWWLRAASGSVTPPTVGDSGDHQLAVMMRFDRCITSGIPFHLATGNVVTSASTTGTIPGGTTTEDNCLVIGVCTTGLDSATGDFSGHTADAPALANLTERYNGGTTAGNGSGMLIVTGEKAAKGAFGTVTTTLGTTFRQCRMMLALLGEVE